MAPTRLVDTRVAKGAHPFGAAEQQSVVAPAAVAGYDTYALAADVTAVAPTTNTYLTPGRESTPARPGRGQHPERRGRLDRGQRGTDQVGPGNVFDIYNSSGTTNVLVDVSGRFDVFPSENPNPFGSALVGAARSRSGSPAKVAGLQRQPVGMQSAGTASPLG